MRRIHMFLMVAFVVLVVGCTVAITKDAQLTNQGFEALTKGEYSQAETFFDQALAENPDNPYALLNQGVVYQNTNRPEKAKEMYEKVIALNPTERAGRSNIGESQGKPLVQIARENLKALE